VSLRAFLLRLLCLALLVAPLGWVSPVAAAVDTATAKYCSPKADNVVVYVDRTTNYDAKDKRDLLDGVSAIFGALKGGERFSIRTIADSFASSESLIDACMPVCASQGFFGDLFSSACTEGVAINDRNHLRDRVVAMVEKLLDSYSDLPYSAIVQTLALTANAEIMLDEHKQVLIVPENAVSYDAQKNAFVQIPDKNQKDGTRKIAVAVGLSNGSQTEIVKGLKEGDQVVLQQ